MSSESRIERAAREAAIIREGLPHPKPCYELDASERGLCDHCQRIINTQWSFRERLEALLREAAKVSCYQWSCNTADKRDEESNRYPGHDCECVAPQILEHFGLAPEEE